LRIYLSLHSLVFPRRSTYLLLPETDPQKKLPDTALNTQSLATNPFAGNDKTWCRSTKPRYVKMAYGCGIDAQ
ncbi:hypothetical protein, partial [Nostoc sp. PCC 9305]|uniref:hypothetical protein n=1 Tax=Nostoc sp. PCC 9305 TaxID=296636 RepID=UPI0039C6E3C5